MPPRSLLLAALLFVAVGPAQAQEQQPDPWLKQHTGPIRSLAVSPDGKLIATGSYDGNIILWDSRTRKPAQVCEGHGGWVYSLTFTRDGRRLVSSAGDSTVRVWEVNTGKELQQIKGTIQNGSAGVSPDGKQVAAGGNDSAVTAWDAGTGQALWRQHIGHLVSSVVYARDGKSLFVGSHDGAVHMLDAGTGKEIRKFRGHTSSIYDVDLSPDGRSIVTASFDKSVRLWEVATGQERLRLDGHTACVMCAAFLPDGRVVSGGHDETVRLWEVATGREVARLDAHHSTVYAVAVDPRGRWVVSGDDAKRAHVWPVNAAAPPPGAKLTDRQLQSLWGDLAGDAQTAHAAAWKLTADPDRAIPFLRQVLRGKQQPAPDPDRVKKWITDLDNDQFRVRVRAADELEKLGRRAAPLLRKALEGNLSIEARQRLEQLLAKVGPSAGEEVRPVRAIEVIERVGGAAARDLLHALSDAVDPVLRAEAAAALARLE